MQVHLFQQVLEKKSKERSFAYFPLRPISIIHSSFPLGVLFLFPLVSDSVENASKQPLPEGPLGHPRSADHRFSLTPFTGSGATFTGLWTGCSRNPIRTQWMQRDPVHCWQLFLDCSFLQHGYNSFYRHLWGCGLFCICKPPLWKGPPGSKCPVTTYSVGDVSRPRSSESESVRPVWHCKCPWGTGYSHGTSVGLK